MKKIMIAFWLLCSTIALSAQTLRQSVENGVQTSVRQSENHEWREAFATCRALDAMIGNGNPDLHYLVAKERFRLYYHIKKMPECRAQEEIDSKATKITAQWVFIVVLIIIAAGLGAALAFFLLLMFKNVREIKRLKESLSLANSNNAQKNRFLNNISAQIRPALNAMENGDTKRQIKALQSYMDHIERYMALEQTRDEHYQTAEENMAQFCQTAADEVKKIVRQGTAVTYNSQSFTFSTNAEALREIVLGIVGEAVKHDGVERITIEFKKRNPHTGHLNITVVGMRLPEEKRESLFQAFTETVDLTEGDGLTYPTCSLLAYKLDGHLRLDDEYRQGTRFVLELKG